MQPLTYIAIGIFAGAISGLIGIGGGIIIVPLLVLIFGFTQHAAQGTTLAMFTVPIGLAAAWTYYKHGHINLLVTGLLCLGFVLGGYFGGKIAVGLSEAVLRKVFGACLLAIAAYMIIK